MQPEDLQYASLKKRIARYEAKGRSESAAFLNWFLENVYRLDDVAADDAICDKPNDKGIDAIYIDHNSEEIHFLQSKIRQNPAATVGDVALKNLAGSLAQFETPEAVDALLKSEANALLKTIVEKSDLKNLIGAGYQPVGFFVTNESLDKAANEYLSINKAITVYDRDRIAKETIDIERDGGIKESFSFEVDYVAPLKFEVGSEATAYLFPALASELVRLKGISDGTLFSQNVRLSLGSTPVNRAIALSIQDKTEHRYFPLFHNGIILLCGEAKLERGRLEIKDYVVVNGAQSLSTFFKNEGSISKDLRILVKVIALRDAGLAQKITLNSNNQNAIKPRDLRSNHDIMLRLKEEFNESGEAYYFEIKRGEESPQGKTIIPNDIAGRMLLAFDLYEPNSCHQLYRVFDEKYADIFGRKEVDCYRVIFLWKVIEIIESVLPHIDNKPFANYGLTKYFLLYVVSKILDGGRKDRAIVANPRKYWGSQDLSTLYGKIEGLLKGLVVDLNYEVKEIGDVFDYKADLKSPTSVEALGNKLIRDYEKDVKRDKAVAFD